MSNSIEDWRKQHTLPKQAPLPGLLSKLNILPQPERLPPPDDSALDTRSESSMEGSYSSPHHLSLSPMPPTSQPLTSPALAAQQRQVSGSGPPQSLTKANLLSPGRRASMVSHSPSMDKGASSPGGQGSASLTIGGGGPGMSRLTIVRAPSLSKERSASSSHGSDYGGHHRRRSSSGSHHGSSLQPMTSSSPQVGSQRLSFAFTTFGGASNPSSAPGTPPGEASDPVRPGHSHSYSSSSLNRRGSLSASGGHGGGREDARDLTPREVVDLARETAQVNHQEDGASSVAGGGGQEMEPVEFVPLTDEVLLPFDERPEEVQGLMDEDRNKSLFKLIEINFPQDPPSSPGRGWKAKDPSVWTYADFAVVLGQVDRAELPDAQWARLIRKALKPRSEPLWEKLKGCLGIEEDEFEDGEVRLVGESAPGSPSLGYSGGAEDEHRIFIEGLVEGEGVPMSDEKAFGGLGVDTGRRASSDDGGNSLIAGGGLFSPEPAGDGGLPSLISLAGGSGMEAIGEEQEDSPPPSRQATQMPSTAAFAVPPAIRTTLASPDADPTPRSSFSFYPTTDTPTPSSPSVAATDLKPLPVNQTYQPTSPLSRTGSDLPQSSSASTKSRKKSFVGISILSSSPSPSHQAPPLSPTSPGASSYTPSLDDASYGGRHYEGSPAAYRGPGSPLFPSSFASLSLQSGGSASSFGGRRKLSTSGGQ